MLTTAFILINTKPEALLDTALKQIGELPEVKEINALYGVFDLVAKVQVETMAQLRNQVFNKIRKIDKVRSTVTLVVR